MIKKLTRHGNSYALVIPKPLLELLKINEKTKLEIFTNGRSLYLLPLRGRNQQKKLEDTLAELKRKYGKTFKRLAD